MSRTIAAVLPALLLLAACDASTGFSASPMVNAATAAGNPGTAPAVANMHCIGAGAKAFDRPWQTIVLGGSRRTLTGNYEIQVTNGSDGTQAICTVTRDGMVLAIAPA